MRRAGATENPTREARAARRAVLAIFFVCGAATATWIANIPAVKHRFALDDATLGVTLLALSVGSVVALVSVGSVVGRFGSRAVTRVTTLAACLIPPILLLVPSYPLLVLTLGLFGLAIGAMDVAMNAQAVAIEARYRRPIMSSFHALYSAGGLAGAGAASVLLARGLSSPGEVLLATALLLGTSAIALRALLPGQVDRTSEGARLALPTGPLAILGVLALLAMLSEGAIGDWGAVYLRDAVHADPSLAASGFAAFSFAMVLGRLGGDPLRARFPSTTLVRAGGSLAALSLAVGLLLHDPVAAVVGFAGVGLGLANVVPILFSAAGRTRGVAPGMGLAAVATAGYGGFLLGPPLIGFVSQATSLAIGLGLVALCTALIAILGRVDPDLSNELK